MGSKRSRWMLCLLAVLLLYFSPMGGNNGLGASSSQISLDVRNADLRDVLSILAVKANTNIVLIEEPVTITFSVEKVSPMQALDLILQSKGLSYVREGGLLIVGKPAKLQNRAAETTLVRFDLVYLRTEQFEPLLRILGLPVNSFVFKENPNAIWIQGTPGDLVKVKELLLAVDQMENAIFEGTDSLALEFREVATYAIAPSRMVKLLQQIGVPLERYVTVGNRLLVFDRAIREQWDEFNRIVMELDWPDARESSIFSFPLQNLVAQDAAERLTAFGYSGVRVVTFNFAELSKELMIICPPELESLVRTALAALDVAPERIRAVITSADGEFARRELQAKRKLLAEMTSVSVANMYISDNLSGDPADPHYVLWAHETPDRIKMLQNLAASFE